MKTACLSKKNKLKELVGFYNSTIFISVGYKKNNDTMKKYCTLILICIVFGLDGVGQHLYSLELLGINKSNAKSSYEVFSNEFKTTDRDLLDGALHFQSSAYISSEEISQYAEVKGFTVKSFQILYQEESKTQAVISFKSGSKSRLSKCNDDVQ